MEIGKLLRPAPFIVFKTLITPSYQPLKKKPQTLPQLSGSSDSLIEKKYFRLSYFSYSRDSQKKLDDLIRRVFPEISYPGFGQYIYVKKINQKNQVPDSHAQFIIEQSNKVKSKTLQEPVLMGEQPCPTR